MTSEPDGFGITINLDTATIWIGIREGSDYMRPLAKV